MANSSESWGNESILKPLVCRRRRAISRRKSGRRPRTTSARRKRRETVSCAVSLDGALIFPDGEAHRRKASCGTVSSRDMKVNHLKTSGPNAGKETLKAQVAEEVVRKVRPALNLAALAAPDNKTFLKKLRADERRSINFLCMRTF